MISLKCTGDFSKTIDYLNKIKKCDFISVLERYGEEGVKSLEEYTPKRTGLTSRSWRYVIERNMNETSLNFLNSNIQNGVNIAIIIQFGHGTASGAYIQGRDYINPALQPVFDNMVKELWKEVTK